MTKPCVSQAMRFVLWAQQFKQHRGRMPHRAEVPVEYAMSRSTAYRYIAIAKQIIEVPSAGFDG